MCLNDVCIRFLIDYNNDGTPDELIDPIFGDGTSVVDVDYAIVYVPGASNMTLQTQKYEGHWIWVDVDDPWNNQRPILKIVRSDNKTLNVMNYWAANGRIYFVDDPVSNYSIIWGSAGSHNVAVMNVTLSKSIVGQTFSVGITVTLANLGNFTETFNISVFADSTIISSFVNTSLSSGDSSSNPSIGPPRVLSRATTLQAPTSRLFLTKQKQQTTTTQTVGF